MLDDRFVEHAVVDRPVHRPGERAQRAVGDAIDRREVGLRDGHLGELGRLGLKGLGLVGGNGAADGLRQAAMGRNQISHCRFPVFFLRLKWWSGRGQGGAWPPAQAGDFAASQ